MEKKVMLVAFYNYKAAGVRILERALRDRGFEVVTVFFKAFNSVSPRPAAPAELELLSGLVQKHRPLLVGLSVMSSMYLETVCQVLHALKKNTAAPVLCGGAHPTLFPEQLLRQGADFVLRTDGERSICQLAQAIWEGADLQHIPSLCYWKNEKILCNPIGNICDNLDDYGIPMVECPCAYAIEHGRLKKGDPQLTTPSYEVFASRGCPFSCSYCCCSNLRRLYRGNGKYLRTRSVGSVIAELREARQKLKQLVYIHFYDEIFPNDPAWVQQFAAQYKREIGLPFTIWSHPLMADSENLRQLVEAGLCEVVMGIQSGSEHIRRDIFHRLESQEDIIRAARALKRAEVPWVSYDFMLQHPFETMRDLKETYRLVEQLEGRFSLQLHGLNFLPGSDIVQMAVDQGYISKEGMKKIMYAPMREQFGAYWKQGNGCNSWFWYRLIFCLQFPLLRRWTRRFSKAPHRCEKRLRLCYFIAGLLAKARALRKKSGLVLRSLLYRRAAAGQKIKSGAVFPPAAR